MKLPVFSSYSNAYLFCVFFVIFTCAIMCVIISMLFVFSDIENKIERTLLTLKHQRPLQQFSIENLDQENSALDELLPVMNPVDNTHDYLLMDGVPDGLHVMGKDFNDVGNARRLTPIYLTLMNANENSREDDHIESQSLSAAIYRAENYHTLVYLGGGSVLVVLLGFMLTGIRFFSPYIQHTIAAERRTRHIIDTTDYAILMVNQSGHVTFANKAFCHIVNQPMISILNESLPLASEDEVSLQKDIFYIFKTGNNIESTLLHVQTDQGYRLLNFTLVPYRQGGQIVGVVATAKDISKQYKFTQLLEETLRITATGGWEINLITDKLHCTRETYRIHDFEPKSSITLKKALQSYTLQSQKKLKQLFRAAKHTGENWNIELQLNTEYGGDKWVRSIGYAEVVDGVLVRLAGTVQDISAIKKVQMKLLTLSRAVDQSGNSVMITDKKGIIEYVNPSFTAITGYETDEVIGKTAKILRSENTDDATYRQLWDTILSGNDWSQEILNQRKDGSEFWASQTIFPIKNEQGDTLHFVSVTDDVTEKKQTQEELKRLAFYDVLTGLGNRRLLRKNLLRTLENLNYKPHKSYLFFLDVDKFKRINDTLGHDAGDSLLQQVAHRLKSCIGDSGEVYRLGGDEFTVLLPEVLSIELVYRCSQDILNSFKETFSLGGQDLVITTSLGIAIAPNDGMNSVDLMKSADLAMYKSKQQGGNRVNFYSSAMQNEAKHHLRMESDLRHALKNNEFELYYQPRVTIKDNRIIAAEALVRWNQPKRGLISPSQFISIAEDTGLIIPIGNWILNEACRQAKNIENKGIQGFTISVNLSPIQFNDVDLLDCIKQALSNNDLPATCLEIEITESMLMTHLEKTISLLYDIRELGVKISIDDFGTGYSSLSYLKKFPVNTLKIDRSFIKDMPNNQDDVAITKAIVAMAHSLGVEVVAEGVESQDQHSMLYDFGCEMAQGFLYHKPLSAENFDVLLS